jgi:hypothetical protein
MNKELEKITDEISFRLLATRKHPDYEWLYNKLKEFRYEEVKLRHPFIEVFKKYWNFFTFTKNNW